MIDLIHRVTTVFTQLDQQITQFQIKTGLRCPDNCGGVCCRKEDVHTTSLEMLPVAHDILRQGTGAAWLERIQDRIPAGRCVFYESLQPEEASGHCTMYALRPLICRLFGFATIRNRTGGQRLSTCRIIRQAAPEIVAAANHLSSDAPCLSDVGAWLFAIDSGSGSRLLPINEALQQALRRMGLYMQLAHGESLSDNSAA